MMQNPFENREAEQAPPPWQRWLIKTKSLKGKKFHNVLECAASLSIQHVNDDMVSI